VAEILLRVNVTQKSVLSLMRLLQNKAISSKTYIQLLETKLTKYPHILIERERKEEEKKKNYSS